MPASFFQDSHAINIATILVGMFAGLYGYYSLLGNPKGILRRFLVAIPSGVTYGIYNLVYDASTHSLLSRTISGVLQLPVSSLTLGVFGAAGGFILPFAFPNIYRAEKEDPSVFGTSLRVIVLTASQAIGNMVLLRLTLIRFNPFHGYQPPLAVLLIVSVVLSFISALFTVQSLTRQRQADSATMSWVGCLGSIFAIVFSVALLALSVLFIITLAALIGWALLIYTVLLFVVLGILILIQYWADNLRPQQLGYISLLLFLAAGSLQLYQAVFLNGASMSHTPSGAITEFPVPSRGGSPVWIVTGPDHALWFTEPDAHRIGRISPSGTVTEFQIPRPNLSPSHITSGSDDALWFTATSLAAGSRTTTGWIGRITLGGQFTLYVVPVVGSAPIGISSGSDGRLWFADAGANAIGQITLAGKIKEYHLATRASGVFDIASGPDGGLWFTERLTGRIGRIGINGAIREWTLPTRNGLPTGITRGPDGALWFTEEAGKIGRISTSGMITERAISDQHGDPTAITTAPDGVLWFTEQRLNLIGRMTVDGRVNEYTIPTAGSSPSSLTIGPDGALWFTESNANSTNTVGKIGRLAL